ncbi:23S rRNA (guanosine(2251)-2'-O)-methyltransferase RlmB [Hyphococcus sp.]|jgi:23S rRNA (guanosine2251-2'-O)-methyltransferase|uniref:23S rRNA (guanosine(2251)-2'-O)-methyltransferase RlmB n=1 Tax=Hyphococcus sp. TaxID=2038636 RepID=UPI003D1464DC
MDKRRPKPQKPAAPEKGASGKGRPKLGRPRHGAQKTPEGAVWLYGRHAVAAALANPNRKVKRVLATKNSADWLAQTGIDEKTLSRLEDMKPDAIDRLLHEGAVHQGLAALAEELPRARLKEVCAPAETGAPVLVLDQITDPQNIGALFRSAAAFGAKAVIVQERRTPPLAGALAKAAAGAIEIVPCVQAVNIARALEALKDLGYHCAGLAGEADAYITEFPATPLALVMGAEGAGLRQLVAATCDKLYRIPIAPGVESLNVSNAAAISLYEARRARNG